MEGPGGELADALADKLGDISRVEDQDCLELPSPTVNGIPKVI